MPQADFAYAPAADSAAAPLAISIFADHPHVRAEIRDDAEAAGLAVRECSEAAALPDGESRPLGEVVVVDCPRADPAMLAAIARLDTRAARSGGQLIISTTVEALDAVFACCDQSAALILVDPTRSERVIALGGVLAGGSGLRLRELAEDDRLTLLRLTQQVGEIAQRLERLGGIEPTVLGDGKAFRLESPGPAYKGADPGDALVRKTRPPLPDPRLVRRIIRQRQMRAQFFDRDLFADPAWDMLLDLTAARAEHARVSVTSLCIASGVPPTTALRWIGQMTGAGLFRRIDDDTDRRRAFIALSDMAADAMARYFAELGRQGAQLA